VADGGWQKPLAPYVFVIPRHQRKGFGLGMLLITTTVRVITSTGYRFR
jgi:GNAT superfamily N-acetyltransferase